MQQTFQFKKYISNGWYFLLVPDLKESFPAMLWDEEQINVDEGILKNFKSDASYESKTAQLFDLGFRAFNQGVFVKTTQKRVSELVGEVPLADEYRFIRKYYKSFWIYYIYFLRLLSLKNPVKETIALLKSRNISRVPMHAAIFQDEKYKSFRSALVAAPPKVSVIIPTLNRYKYLKDAIEDLEKQTVPIHELIVVDQSDAPDEMFYKQFKIPIKLIIQKERGQWLARNAAIRECTGEWLLFFDDDSRVESDWVEEHLKGVDFYKADISAGVSISKIGDKIPQNYSFFRWADQFDSGNALVHRKVFEKIGMFDRQFDRMRMGDGEFGLRAYLHGYVSISHPYAQRLHLKVSEGGLRQVGSWDAFRTKKLFAPIPIPSVSYYYLKYFNSSALNILFFQNIFSSTIPYKHKNKTYLIPIYILFTIVKFPVTLSNYFKSKKQAKKMMLQGALIDQL